MVAMTLIVLLLTPLQPTSAAQSRRLATLDVRVTDRTGTPVEGARVTAEGPVGREGETSAEGSITFRNVAAGVYRFHVEREGFIGLEKEVTVRAGTVASVEAALSVAPAPPPPPLPPVTAPPKPAATLSVGEPRMLSIPDLAEEEFIGGREPLKENPIGCSGATAARLVQIRDPLATQSHAEADEMLYVVAGDATLRLGEHVQTITPGWFSIVPRGTEYSLTRRGRNPVILLSILAGQPCPDRPLSSHR